MHSSIIYKLALHSVCDQVCSDIRFVVLHACQNCFLILRKVYIEFGNMRQIRIFEIRRGNNKKLEKFL
jgi:hypothetical protein